MDVKFDWPAAAEFQCRMFISAEFHEMMEILASTPQCAVSKNPEGLYLLGCNIHGGSGWVGPTGIVNGSKSLRFNLNYVA
ncbi:Protein of unknown function D [Prunus dulcis]|uniref:Uncharacterized protein n=1 Tax=Prunus dulcis TaxID=3755 RepID=A0A4Y1R5J0_PRUDU|nr:Protein of unknown function D [Prunus dulcis]